MQAPRFLRVFSRIRAGVRGALSRKQIPPSPPTQVNLSARMAGASKQSAAVAAAIDGAPRRQQPVASPAPQRPAPVDPLAPVKGLRSLEEYRADLVRLRAQSRQRHASAPVRRTDDFPVTDFMDYPKTRIQPRGPSS